MFAKLALVAFWLWVPAIVVPGVYLMAGHLLTLPMSDGAELEIARAVQLARAPEERSAWMALHVLSGDCGCSQRVLAHLVERGPLGGLREKILFLGEPTALVERAREKGFGVELLTAERLLSRYRIEAAPLLVVADPHGELRYLGGYTERKQSPVIEDAAMLQRLLRGERVAPLPLFGCAVSRKLQEALDPLGLKY